MSGFIASLNIARQGNSKGKKLPQFCTLQLFDQDKLIRFVIPDRSDRGTDFWNTFSIKDEVTQRICLALNSIGLTVLDIEEYTVEGNGLFLTVAGLTGDYRGNDRRVWKPWATFTVGQIAYSTIAWVRPEQQIIPRSTTLPGIHARITGTCELYDGNWKDIDSKDNDRNASMLAKRVNDRYAQERGIVFFN